MSPQKVDPSSGVAVWERLDLLQQVFDPGNQAAFSRRLKIGVQHWNNYRMAKRLPSRTMVMALNAKTGAPTDWIYFGREDVLPGHLREMLEKAKNNQ